MNVLLTWKPTSAEMEVIDRQWPDVDLTIEGRTSSDDLARSIPDTDVMVGYMRGMPRDRLEAARALRLVHVLGHGVDALLKPGIVDLLRERDVQVARSNPCSIPIAEFVIMNMIALSRRTVPLHNALTQRGDWSTDLWARRGEGVLGGELNGSTLGIIGYGNIAREVRARAGVFGLEVGAIARRPETLADEGLSFVHAWDEMHEFLRRCDHVVLTIPLTPQTRRLIGRDELMAMRPGAFLINVSRGGLVDEEALWEALSSGHLGGAALDVFESEDDVARSGYPLARPIHQFNTILTPHYSGATAEARSRALTTVGDNLRRLLAGEPLRNVAELSKGF